MPVWLGVLLVVAGVALVLVGAALVVRREVGSGDVAALSKTTVWDVLKEIITHAGPGGVLMIFGLALVFVGAAGLGVELGWFGGSDSNG